MVHRIVLVLTLAASWQAAGLAVIQFPEHPRTLHSPAKVKGDIGGESHDTYVIKARQGQIMTVRISWVPERDEESGGVDNKAQFQVSTAPDFDGTGDVKFGQESDNGKTWTGKIPKTRKYYIYVIAFPAADYTLRVTLK
jgi:hypothetical protein